MQVCFAFRIIGEALENFQPFAGGTSHHSNAQQSPTPLLSCPSLKRLRRHLFPEEELVTAVLCPFPSVTIVPKSLHFKCGFLCQLNNNSNSSHSEMT